MMSSKKYLVAILICTSGLAYGQNSDSLAIEKLVSKAKSYSGKSQDSALYFADKAVQLSQKGKFTDLQAVSYHTKGTIFDKYELKDSAEFWYLKWLAIRRTQSPQKVRWALKGLQNFYKKHGEIDKLHQINRQYLEALEQEFCIKSSENTCDFKYEVASRRVISDMVDLGGYRYAEEYFLEVTKVTNDEPAWYDEKLVYYQIEKALLNNNDSDKLEYWYNRWFVAIDSMADTKAILNKTVNILIAKKRWNKDYMRPAIGILELAYPNLEEKEKTKLLGEQVKNFKSGYLKMSAGYLIYLVIQGQELLEPSTPEKNKKLAELFKGMGKRSKEIDAFSQAEIVYILDKYGLTSSSDVIRESSEKLLKKIQ